MVVCTKCGQIMDTPRKYHVCPLNLPQPELPVEVIKHITDKQLTPSR